MAGAYTAVDLSQLPVPDAVETLDYETILADMLADLQSRGPSFTALVESDPAYKVLEVCAYRELLIRKRVNEAVKAVMLAYAKDSDLEQIAARYDVERLLIQAADDTTIPPTEAVYEDDDSLRRRVQLAFEGFSTAGPEGAYIFHTLGASSDVLDASANSPTPGVVQVAVLSRTGDGTAPAGTLAAVTDTLSGEDVRPLTDNVTVKSATIKTYAIAATLTLFSGPDASVVMQTANDAISAYAAKNHRLGRDVTLSGIYAALHQEGVQNVALTAPVASIVNGWDEAAYCTGIALTNGGIGD